jgi:hypothetical protein
MEDRQIHELEHLAATLVNARNVLRAGGTGTSKITPAKDAPTVQQTLDQASVRIGNLLADVYRKNRGAELLRA